VTQPGCCGYPRVVSRELWRDWTTIAVLYALILVLYRLLGNFAAAGEAFRRWGRYSSSERRRRASSG
jgi:hypothetical protein